MRLGCGRAWLWLAGGALAGLLLIPGVAQAAAGAAAASLQASDRAVRWGLLIGFGGALAIAVGAELVGAGRGVLIGTDGRVSTSKTVAAAWTLIVVAGLIGLVYADLIGHPEALNATNDSGVVGQYALLFGGPLGAAIAAKGIVTKQVNDNPSAKSTATSTGVSDVLLDDAGNTDLGDFQYVAFNLVAMIFVIGNLLVHPSLGLPRLPDVLLGLTSVSAVGYVGKKALTPAAVATGKLQPDHGPVNTTVQITLDGLSPTAELKSPLWVRFNEHPGASPRILVDGSTAIVSANAPTLEPASRLPVKVTVITAIGNVIDAGTFTYD
jgi:hypothetical protein